jgi:hypothetical protein
MQAAEVLMAMAVLGLTIMAAVGGAVLVVLAHLLVVLE